jgi:hypothetical protein
MPKIAFAGEPGRPSSSVSWYRSSGVLPKLKQIDPSIEVELLPQAQWLFLAGADILFLDSPNTRDYMIAAIIAKEYGLKLWIDFNDNLLDPPMTHPRYNELSDHQAKEAIWKCCELADVITVSTAYLKTVFGKFASNVVIVANAFNDYNLKMSEKPGENQLIVWRGGDTHWHDLLSVAPQIWKMGEDMPEMQYIFIGTEPNVRHIVTNIQNVKVTGEYDVVAYHSYLKSLSPAVLIHPIVETPFALGKSNAAWIEATMAGAVAVLPNMSEMIKPGAAIYTSPMEFEMMVREFLADEDQRKRFWDNAVDYIQKNLLLSQINKKRVEIVRQLMR